MLAYSWEVKYLRISQEFCNIVESCGHYGFRASHNFQIWIESIPKEFDITSLLGQNIFASKWIWTRINYKHSFNLLS